MRKVVICMFLITISFHSLLALQISLKLLPDEKITLDFLRKIFSSLDSFLHINSVNPPTDSAIISIPVYPPIPPLTVSADYQHRIGAYEAWQDGDYQGIIDSLKLVKNPIDVDHRLLANSYYRLNNLILALEAGERITNPDGNTLYALGLFAMRLKEYNRAAKNFKSSVERDSNLVKAHARLGDLYYISGKHEDALKYWLKAKQQGFDEHYINYFIGYIYFEKAELDKAAEYFAYLDDLKIEENWRVRAKYFQALIQERKGSREAALEILSEIELHTYGMSEIEYDILKKKIYSHFWLGLKNYYDNPDKSYEHLIKSEALISGNLRKFTGADRIIIELLKGVLQRLSENIKGIKKHTISSQHFHSFAETWLTFRRTNEMNEKLIIISAEILYQCQEPILAARFFNELKEYDQIAAMNYYILQPQKLEKIPEISYAKKDTLSPYILFNYMGICYQKEDYKNAEKLFQETLKSLKIYSNIKYYNGLKYASYLYRSRWLDKILSQDPEKLVQSLNIINNRLNEIKIENPDISLPKYLCLPNGRLFLLAINQY